MVDMIEIPVERYEKMKKAIKHILNRIERDPNIQWYCGACTETLRLLADAWGDVIDENPRNIERAVSMSECGEAEVNYLKRRIEEFENIECCIDVME